MKPKIIRINLRRQAHHAHCSGYQTLARIEIRDGDVIHKGQVVVGIRPVRGRRDVVELKTFDAGHRSTCIPLAALPLDQLDGVPAVVVLGHCVNPDIGDRGGYWSGKPQEPASRRVVVTSFEHASRLCREYIEKYDLGAGNWSGGEIRDANENVIAYVSYNGRVWRGRTADEASKNGEEIKLNQAPKGQKEAVCPKTKKP